MKLARATARATPHTDPLFSELKLLKVNEIFSLNKLLFMFNFIKEIILEELKRLFIFNKSAHRMKLSSSKCFIFQMVYASKTSQFGLNTLSYDCAKLWTKFFHALLRKETALTKCKLKN